MKKLLLFTIILMAAFTIKAQETATAPVTKTIKQAKISGTSIVKQVANPAAFACPKCYAISKGEGKCNHCQVDKVQLGTYYCEKCQKATGKAGPCPGCKGETVRITRKYCAEHGGTPLRGKGVKAPDANM